MSFFNNQQDLERSIHAISVEVSGKSAAAA
jgi:hypothetical protein